MDNIEKLAKKSKLTKKDVELFSKKIKALAVKRFLSKDNLESLNKAEEDIKKGKTRRL